MKIQNHQATELSHTKSNETQASNNPPSATEIQTWIISYLAELLEIDRNEVDLATSFEDYGLDSAAAIGLTGDLSDWLKKDLEPTLVYDYSTIPALVQHLTEKLSS